VIDLAAPLPSRMLAMLNAWVTEHKPVVVKGPTP